MKSLAILGMLATAGISSAAILWDQSQLINMSGAGTGTIAGQHLSMLEAGETIFGYGVQGPAGNVLADDFTVGAGGAVITGFSVFSYITGATAPGVTAVNWAIGNTMQGTGLTTTNVASTFWLVGGQRVNRVNVGDTSNAGGVRQVQVTTVTGLNINVGAGTSFLSFSVNPGNFSPPLPTSLASHGMNAAQYTTAVPTFTPVINAPGQGADMAFIIEGNAVPEPATMAVLGLGAAALLRRRRKQ